MPIPSEGFPLSAAVSPRVHVIETVDSTNAKLLRDAADDPDGHPHLSVVVTRDQRAGRGRLDRAWTTPPGSALAVSVLSHRLILHPEAEFDGVTQEAVIGQVLLDIAPPSRREAV